VFKFGDGEDQLEWSCESPGGEEYLHTIKRRMANWIGHILCMNFLPKHVTEIKREG